MKWSKRGAENLGNLLMKVRYEKNAYESLIVEVMKLVGGKFAPMTRHD